MQFLTFASQESWNKATMNVTESTLASVPAANATEGPGSIDAGGGLFKTPLPYQTVLAYVLLVITGVGLVLNAMVLYIVVRHRDMHRVTNFFFANLALTDFLLLLMHGTTASLEMLGYYAAVQLGCSTVQYSRYVSKLISKHVPRLKKL